MKKIMFNDRYGLTEAVLSGRKTVTRRLIPQSTLKKVDDFMVDYHNQTLDSLTEIEVLNQYFFVEEIGKLPYKVGEVVAIAQAYSAAGFGDTAPIIGIDENDMPIIASDAGIYNKMFVRANLMPHQIRITNVRVERLQDISDEDCIKEGIEIVLKAGDYIGYGVSGLMRHYRDFGPMVFDTPREAYAALIDRISGKGTWESNPYVFVYEFELLK